MTARELLDADRWIDWDAEGHLVFARGPFAGDRLGDLGLGRLGSLAEKETTPESTRDVLDRYTGASRGQEDTQRRAARRRRAK